MADIDAQHVVPLGDHIRHDIDSDGDCVCGPRTDPVHRLDGSIGWVYVHHSLDGRENHEVKIDYYRVTTDRWKRTWQAEWDGCNTAPRAWTRRGIERKAKRWAAR